MSLDTLQDFLFSFFAHSHSVQCFNSPAIGANLCFIVKTRGCRITAICQSTARAYCGFLYPALFVLLLRCRRFGDNLARVFTMRRYIRIFGNEGIIFPVFVLCCYNMNAHDELPFSLAINKSYLPFMIY